jgi:hypothetical protein
VPLEIDDAGGAAGFKGVSRAELQDCLDELAASRLVYRDGDRYLALALPV